MAKEKEIEELNENDKAQRLEVLRICAASFLETRDFRNADKYYLEILEIDSQDFDAYLNLVMIDCKTTTIEELFNYYSKQNIDPATKISSKINSLYANKNRYRNKDNNDTQHFSFTTYRTIQNLYEEYLKNKDKKYLEYIDIYNSTEDIAVLNDLILKFEELKDYKDAARYINRCKNKIDKSELDNKSNERKLKISNLLTIAEDFLQSSEYKLADEYYSEVLQLDPNNIDAYLGILMVDTKTNNKEELFEYYQNLYIDDETEILEACKKDVNHINEMIDKYEIPGYLDAETIKKYYDYDITYLSTSRSRKKNKEKIFKLINNNPYLKKLRDFNDAQINKKLDEIKELYDDRLKLAKKQDKENITRISGEYQRHIFSTYRTIQNLYEEYLKNKDKKYLEYIDIYNSTEDIAVLNDLILKFEELKDYKDAARYINRCKNKIDKSELDNKSNERKLKISNLLTIAEDFLQSSEYKLADEYYSEVLQLDPNNIDAYLGILMVDTKTNNKEELFEYYQNLYIDDETEILEACKKDVNHINEMIDKYEIPGYLDAETIENYYEFDSEYVSLLSCRKEQRRKIAREFELNPVLSKIEQIDKDAYRELFSRIIAPYNQKVYQAEAEDNEIIDKLTREYNVFVSKTDKKVIEKYNANASKVKKSIKETVKETVKESIPFISKPIVSKPKTESKKKGGSNLDDAYNLLSRGNYNGAKEILKNIISNNPDNTDAYLGMLMVETKTKNMDDLFDYYKNLYDYNDRQKVVAVEEDRNHIDGMIEEYHSKNLSKKTIADRYKYDRSFDSVVDAKIRGKKALMNAISTNKNFYNIVRIGDEELVSEIQKLVDIYDRRVKQAKKDDEAMAEIVRNDYDNFLAVTDEEIINLANSNVVVVDSKPSLIDKIKNIKLPEIDIKPKKKKQEAVEEIKEVVTKEEVKEEIKKERKPLDTNKITNLAVGSLAGLAVIGALFMGGRYYYQNVIVPENRYKDAIKLADNGDYEEAITMFEELGEYKDCISRIEDAKYNLALNRDAAKDYQGALNILVNINHEGAKEKIEEIKNRYLASVEKGGSIFYGLYEQDNNQTNGREVIEWQVIAVEQDRALLISKYVIDVAKYDTSLNENVDWSNSTIRFWLNGKFPDNAFDKEDTSRVLSTNLISYRRNENGYMEEYETNDYVFLLSEAEVENLFENPTTRIAFASLKVINSDVIVNEHNHCGWWLRDLGEESDTAKYVWANEGEVANSVFEVNQGVRPAMWFSLNKEAVQDTQESTPDEGF